MNKLPLPPYDDDAAIVALANNDSLDSFPQLQAVVGQIQAGYLQYAAAQGNAFAILPVPLTRIIGDLLRGHYAQPPKVLSYIAELRADAEYSTCPMCGSFHRGTLDHLLPKSTRPEFSLYSKNLVPACNKCNTKRKNALIGSLPNQRVLHPYFDNVLSGRLIRANFAALGPVPTVALGVLLDPIHPDFPAVQFHMQAIVEKTAIKGYLRKRWALLCRKPSLVVRALRKNPPNVARLVAVLEKELDELDDELESKNNWKSIFVAGLLEPTVLAWLYNKLSAPGRVDNAPLC